MYFLRQKEALFIYCLVIVATSIKSQTSLPDTILASFNNTIHFDGKLNDTAWQSAIKISNFTQQELDFGKPCSEQTQVAVLYDNLAFYVGVWCYQKRNTITAKYLQRDFDYTQDDNFKIALSPFNDKRNGYLFVINPNGARADLLISGNEQANKDWNGVW
ncbi:MAG: hypothetical protein M3O67_10575, partial [Bacteroidota bacterium]|nr:hypothetical protein [Bacteroidota bacterium]